MFFVILILSTILQVSKFQTINWKILENSELKCENSTICLEKNMFTFCSSFNGKLAILETIFFCPSEFYCTKNQKEPCTHAYENSYWKIFENLDAENREKLFELKRILDETNNLPEINKTESEKGITITNDLNNYKVKLDNSTKKYEIPQIDYPLQNNNFGKDDFENLDNYVTETEHIEENQENSETPTENMQNIFDYVRGTERVEENKENFETFTTNLLNVPDNHDESIEEFTKMYEFGVTNEYENIVTETEDSDENQEHEMEEMTEKEENFEANLETDKIELQNGLGNNEVFENSSKHFEVVTEMPVGKNETKIEIEDNEQFGSFDSNYEDVSESYTENYDFPTVQTVDNYGFETIDFKNHENYDYSEYMNEYDELEKDNIIKNEEYFETNTQGYGTITETMSESNDNVKNITKNYDIELSTIKDRQKYNYIIEYLDSEIETSTEIDIFQTEENFGSSTVISIKNNKTQNANRKDANVECEKPENEYEHLTKKVIKCSETMIEYNTSFDNSNIIKKNSLNLNYTNDKTVDNFEITTKSSVGIRTNFSGNYETEPKKPLDNIKININKTKIGKSDNETEAVLLKKLYSNIILVNSDLSNLKINIKSNKISAPKKNEKEFTQSQNSPKTVIHEIVINRPILYYNLPETVKNASGTEPLLRKSSEQLNNLVDVYEISTQKWTDNETSLVTNGELTEATTEKQDQNVPIQIPDDHILEKNVTNILFVLK
ncbi:protein PFC0760c-like isoform X2 [Aethina tumida]|uniref:protein PFC0760c-like isoform X2 n=1 Tax=Aethina tumida TaxID=116153 RepID=UPI0021490BF2|nr:protein PFC0760c-like isoform X2 [Aethina tumida]